MYSFTALFHKHDPHSSVCYAVVIMICFRQLDKNIPPIRVNMCEHVCRFAGYFSHLLVHTEGEVYTGKL